MGTPEPAVVALDTLLGSRHEVAAVLTQPDRPSGRGRAPSPPPVKRLAEERGLPVHQPASPNDAPAVDLLRSLSPDVLAVVAYGHILRPAVLEIAPALNVHFSLLPRYRGAAPVQRALMDGATETGVTVFLLEPTVDTGPVLAQERVAVDPEETAGELLARLAPIGARLLIGCLDGLEAGETSPVPQDPAHASPAPKIKADEARIDWSAPARRVADVVRALNPSPVAWTTFRGRRVNVWRCRPAGTAAGGGVPGQVLAAEPELLVQCASEAVLLEEIQPEGKRRMSAEEYARGYRPRAGERFE